MTMEMSQYLFDRGSTAIKKAVEEGKLPDISYDAYMQKLYYIIIDTNYNLPCNWSTYLVSILVQHYHIFGSMFTNREKLVFFKDYVEIEPEKWLKAKGYTLMESKFYTQELPEEGEY